jgi:hypothetical protein
MMPGGFTPMKTPILLTFFLLLISTTAFADQLGTANGTRIQCPPTARDAQANACYAVTIKNCLFTPPGHVASPGDPQYLSPLTGYLEVNNASSAHGMEMHVIGGHGTQLWNDLPYGSSEINQLVDAGISTVQVTWGTPFTNGQKDGWQSGPGNGIRATMCRYATLQQWVHDKLANGLPMGATGISAGSEEIAGSLAFYHAASILPAGAVFGSGPPFAREDWSCDAVQPDTTNPCSGDPVTESVGITNAIRFIDPSLKGPACEWEQTHKSTKYDWYLYPDSVNAPDADTTWASKIPSSWIIGFDPQHPHNTYYSDTSSATGMAAIHWNNNPGHGGFICTPAPHELTFTQAGANSIAAQVIAQFNAIRKK